MTDSAEALPPHIETTAEIVAAYVSRNSVPMAELPNLIRSIHASLASLGAPPAAETPAAPLVPAVPIRKSVTDEYIVSLEDGRKFKSLKRYLATSHGMTPAEYRAKWGLPPDYPMVAPAYAAKRSALAKTIGLGRKAAEVAEPAPTAEPTSAPAAAEPEAPTPDETAPANDAGKKPRKRAPKAA